MAVGLAKEQFEAGAQLYVSLWSLATNRSIQGTTVTLSDGGFHHRKYLYNNCGKREARYFYYWQKFTGGGLFYKVGQSPELEEHISKTLEENLSLEQAKSYKNAVRMRNFNFGIAAVAYMRRVVENKMSDMLNVLYEAARDHNAPQEVLARHEEMMKERRFTQRVQYAGDLLPENLRPSKTAPAPSSISAATEPTS